MLIVLILSLVLFATIALLRLFYLLNYKKCKNCYYYQILDEVKGRCLYPNNPHLYRKEIDYDYYCENFKL